MERNLVYGVTAPAVNWNVNPGVPALPAWPWPPAATPTRIVNNVFVAERDNAFARAKAAAGRGNSNPVLPRTAPDDLHPL